MPDNYQIVFNQITCFLPSSSLSISDDQAAQNALEVASKVTGLASDLSCVVQNNVCTVVDIVDKVVNLSQVVQGLIQQIDFDERIARKLADNGYISWCPDVNNPQPTEDNHKPASTSYPWTLWPVPNGWPNDIRKGNFHFAKDTSAPNTPFTLSQMPGSDLPGLPAGAVCLFDYDDISTDDLIFAIDLTKVGAFQQMLYNGKQDSYYAFDYVVSVVSIA
jgi:hypothetical protein